MNRKLWLLNIVLLGGVVWAGYHLQQEWVAAKAQRAQLYAHPVKPSAAPPYRKPPDVPPVMATQYAQVAQKYLLDPSRSPDVYVEPKAPPPPPPPMPALPFYHGMMNIGEGPEVNMSATGGSARKWIRAGDSIGEFKVVSFDAARIELEWNGERILKTLDEISGRGMAGPQVQQNAADNSAPPPAAAPPPPPPANVGPDKPEGNNGERACLPNDTMPYGSVVDGVKKILVHNALLNSDNCIWRREK